MAAKSSEWRPGPTVCRCCLTEGCYKDISTEYFWMGKREVYAEMLKETLEVTISYSKTGGPNSNSRLICEPCISRLRDATEFKRQVVECERVFMQHLDPGSTSLDIEVDSEPMEKIKIEGVKLEKSHSDDEEFGDRHFGDDDDDDDDDLDNQPLTKLASRVPKKESVDLLDLLDTSKPAQKRKSTVKVKPPPSKKAKTKIEAAKAKPSSSKAKPEKKKKGEGKSGFKGNRDEEPDDNILKRQIGRNSALVLLQYSNLYPFKWSRSHFICFYCNTQNADVEQFRNHIKDNHNNLDLCQIKKASRKLHSFAPIKVDASDISCKLCHDIIDNIDDLKAHLSNKHEKPIEMDNDGILPFKLSKDSFGCVNCSATYSEYKTLNEHLNVHYRNFICEECGNGFASASRLKYHTASHGIKTYPCNSCDKLFTSTAARRHHVSGVHMKEKLNRCPHCLEAFHTFYQKQRHISTVHGLKIKEFKCDLCPKVFIVSGNLLTHKKVVHFNHKRFTCEVCDSKFYFRSELKKHMNTHGAEKNFACDVCKKCYATAKTLKEHIKIHNNDFRFICAVCGQAFVTNYSLKQHQKHHSTEVKEVS
ncbi:zinc finger and SCAN domain-containing protein 12-like isoform X10 [Plodia interpunctella]|uniref:zinc finger and SCAN domain-containing protein 12-like isoform X10 n=1 Tax=Plodia interpunctella TaxID=58824 RepID=UPI002368628F|nr:zinc finger and SCAN domain-containing protein 12-like isoform X8 [Plodia interpunctella]